MNVEFEVIIHRIFTHAQGSVH